MFTQLRHILEMIRFSHTMFALPFAMLAAVMAWTVPMPDGGDARFRWLQLIGIVVCMVTARSAAMAFNRIADRKLDSENPRTSSRHIPAGVISVRSVAIFTVVNSIAFVVATLLFWPNVLPLVLSIPVLLFLLAYSYTKRYTSMAHFWLGAALMLAPISAWIAIRGEMLMSYPADLLPAFVLGTAVLLWVAGFDIIYACQDLDEDRRAKLFSVPSRFGIVGALRLAAICHFAMIGVLVLLAFVLPELGWIYGCGIAAVATLLLYEHWLVRPDDLTRVNVVFFNINAVVSIGLFVVGALDLLT